MKRVVEIIGNCKYTLKNTESSSAKFGACEVCGNHCSEVFIQTECLRYDGGWTHCDSRGTIFGHKECLLKQRQGV